MSEKEKITEFLIEKAYSSDCELCKIMGWKCPIQLEKTQIDNAKYEPDISACRPFLSEKIAQTLTYTKE